MSLVVAVMENGQILDSKPLDDYVLICGERHELDGVTKYGNGTVVLTIKRIGRA